MRSLITTLFLLLSISGSSVAAEPTDAELGDWMNYLRSVGLEPTVTICGPAIGDEARMRAAADAWSAANRASVERGHATASANPPKGWGSLDAYNAAMVKDYEEKLTSKPAIKQLEICTQYLELLEKRAS
ncbi:hypothetical protein [Lysobacter sp. TY2-98]|uniref:hypothetical protein n=1 Tax=Lysobacter sp. TY2-98 TaxID=2290922 RepID=UPI0013B368C1|nr:hypothetical protein [Lysobacter sp. TY2-98]